MQIAKKVNIFMAKKNILINANPNYRTNLIIMAQYQQSVDLFIYAIINNLV